MCDDDDEEVVPQGGVLHQHLLANGLSDFEVYERTPRQSQLTTQIANMELRLRSMSFLNLLVPYKKSNLSLIREIKDCHLLLEEDALQLESLCDEDVEESSNLLYTVCIGAAIALPIMMLCHVPRAALLAVTGAGLGFFSVREIIGSLRSGMDQTMMSDLFQAFKGFSAICRKSQSLAQEWENVSGNMNILKNTALLRVKMCGVDELKSDLVRYLRQCIVSLTESSRDIVTITTGNDLHPLCMEVMRSEVMVEQNSSLAKAKKLHYLLVLVQSDYLKNVAIGFMPSTKPVYSMAACTATVRDCIAYSIQYVNECTRILTNKYNRLKHFTPQAKMTDSVYKFYNRVSTFGDVRQTVNNITVCLEALTLQSLFAQRALERYDDSAVNSVTDIDHVCNATQDTLLGLQADLHSTQCSVELAVKQLTRLRRSDIERRNQNQIEQEQEGALLPRRISAQTDSKPTLNLSDLPDNIRDEVFELCERSSIDDSDDENGRPDSLQETIQKRAEQRVAGRLMRELKSALVGKRAEMSAREEMARASTQNSMPLNISRHSSTQTHNLEETKPVILADIKDSCDRQISTDISPRKPEEDSTTENISTQNNSTDIILSDNDSIDTILGKPEICLTQNKSTQNSNINILADNNLTKNVSTQNNLSDLIENSLVKPETQNKSTQDNLVKNFSTNIISSYNNLTQNKSTQKNLVKNISTHISSGDINLTQDISTQSNSTDNLFDNNSIENRSGTDLEVTEKIIQPSISSYKPADNAEEVSSKSNNDYNVQDSVFDMFSIADNTSSTTLQSSIEEEEENDLENDVSEIDLKQSESNEMVQEDSSAESMLTNDGDSDLSTSRHSENSDIVGDELGVGLTEECHNDQDKEVQIISKASDFKTISSSDDGQVDSEIQVNAPSSSHTQEDSGIDDLLTVSSGDYLLNNLPKRPKAPRKHTPSRQRYKYEPESGDNRVMGFRLPNEAVTKAREMNLMGAEECFGNSD